MRTADPSADGRRSAAIFASVELPSAGVISSRRPRGDTLLSICDARAHYLLTARVLPTSISTDRIVSGTGLYASVGLSSVRSSSVCLSVPSGRRTPLLQVCCCGPGGQEIPIACWTADARRANAGSATLSAYSAAEHRHRLTFLLSSSALSDSYRLSAVTSGVTITAVS